MERIKQRFQQLSLRSEIIIIFIFIVVLLVLLLSRLAYITMKDIYLNQLNEQATILIRNATRDLETKYLDFFTQESDSGIVKSYYRHYLADKIEETGFDRIFLFTADLSLIITSENKTGESDYVAAMILNKKELSQLKVGELFTSAPFKSQDGKWYLWGFYRLSDRYFLGIKENANRLARVDRLAILFAIIGLAAIIVTLIAGWFLAGMISSPIEQLVKFSQELGKGNFRTPLPENIYGELTMLRNALDKMRSDLENQDKAKEEMLAQIAHELRNPLGGVELLAGLVREDLIKKNLDHTYISQIMEEIQHLKNLLNEYLNYSRPVQVNAKWVEIPKLLNEVETFLAVALRKKSITLTFSGTIQKIWFDPVHLRQILLNLLTNSIDASPPDSRITISTASKGKEVILAISDQGKGIENEYLPKIFQPFFSTKESGIGLGLAVCKKLCLENQAAIYVKNNAEQGCTFYIVKKIQVDDVK